MALKPLGLEKRNQGIEWARRRIADLGKDGFYGTVEISMQNGIPSQLKLHLTEKPPGQVIGNTEPHSK